MFRRPLKDSVNVLRSQPFHARWVPEPNKPNSKIPGQILRYPGRFQEIRFQTDNRFTASQIMNQEARTTHLRTQESVHGIKNS